VFNKYYQDELTYLRQLGREFADAYPQVGHMLAETGTDPDVERLLEGFAFLSGRVRQRLDSELPELTHALVSLLWPHYIRPLPAMTVIQFEPAMTMQDVQVIPRGTEIESKPIDGTRCRFRTTSEVRLYPFTIERIELDVPLRTAAQLKVGFSVSEKAALSGLELTSLRLHLHGEAATANDLYLWLCRHTQAVIYRAGDRQIRIDKQEIRPVGFDDDDALLPYPSHAFPGYRLLQEYFSLPEKFQFVDLPDIAPLCGMDIEGSFEIAFEFDEHPPDRLRINPASLRIGCSPAVNLQRIRSAPIRVDFDKTEYRVRADAPNPEHFEIFSVDRVIGWQRGTVREREYPPFFSYRFDPAIGTAEYYQLRLRPAAVGSGTETYLSFVAHGEDGAMPSTETVAVDLTCSNRNLCEKLRVGDVCIGTSQSPSFASFKNISRITQSVPPPLEGKLLWRLISHLSINYLSLMDVATLRGILSLYNFQALVDRQVARANELRLNGIKSVSARPEDILRHGAIYRGVAISMRMQEDAFACEGEMYLFSTVLNHFLNLYAAVNSYTRMTVHGVQQGGVYEWPPMLGQQILL
jgi:type VI secretion system protein ImpG